jgi:hypothetical protein
MDAALGRAYVEHLGFRLWVMWRVRRLACLRRTAAAALFV